MISSSSVVASVVDGVLDEVVVDASVVDGEEGLSPGSTMLGSRSSFS